jgi:hypothetical protein
MRELTVNRQTLPLAKNKIEYEVDKEKSKDGINIFFTSKTPHGLMYPYNVILRKEYGKEAQILRKESGKYTIPTHRIFPVTVIDDYHFMITFNKYELAKVDNHDFSGKGAVLSFKERSIYEYVNDVNDFRVKSAGVEYSGSRCNKEDNDEDAVSNYIIFKDPMPYVNTDSMVFVKNTWHLNDDGEFDSDNISIYENEIYINISIPFISDKSFCLGDENSIVETYMKDVMTEVIPKVIDNEKRQFLPAMAQGSIFKLSAGLEFNLHFRNRESISSSSVEKILTDTWSTDDMKIWNGFEKYGNGIRRSNVYLNDDNGDELNDLGFTEDDIKFQRKRLKKSFIRLSFYSSKNLLDKELLYYSTIHFDTGKLYQKYCNIQNKIDENTNESLSVFDPDRVDEDLRLSANFSVGNKFDSTKSSEGFYLYLFPDEVLGENQTRTIYMKVEFNHAGFGKTVPMMLPRERYAKKTDVSRNVVYSSEINYNVTNFPLLSTSEDFPLTFMGDEGSTDVERYTDAIMIPVNITYDRINNAYLYYFPWYNRANENKIIINLWEPRMRGEYNGDS